MVFSNKFTDNLVRPSTKSAGLREISRALEEAIDLVKTKQGDAKVILVGGGSIIIGDRIAGVGKIIRPKYLEVANAVGAAVCNLKRRYERADICRSEKLAARLTRLSFQEEQPLTKNSRTPKPLPLSDVSPPEATREPLNSWK